LDWKGPTRKKRDEREGEKGENRSGKRGEEEKEEGDGKEREGKDAPKTNEWLYLSFSHR